MKLFFVNRSLSSLSDSRAQILHLIKSILLTNKDVEEVSDPEHSDAIIIQEENSFKNFHYIKRLQEDHLISAFPEKVFTINSDDCATGLLKGLYTCLPKLRFNNSIYTSVPYLEFPNNLIFEERSNNVIQRYLGSWRGNTKSNNLRAKMVRQLETNSEYCIERTESWLNHNRQEKEKYINTILSAKFSLCPAGWTHASFRIYESMALGRCPVIIADGFVPPEGPSWDEFAFFFPEKNINHLSSFLASNEHLALDFGKNAFNAWQKYFSPNLISEYYANALLSLIRTTPKSSKELEMKRWKSLRLHWSNNWTVPQRAWNKLDRLIKPSTSLNQYG